MFAHFKLAELIINARSLYSCLIFLAVLMPGSQPAVLLANFLAALMKALEQPVLLPEFLALLMPGAHPLCCWPIFFGGADAQEPARCTTTTA